ncbi:MAG: hypothetical protein MN733_13670 [Nitrososphaera sp.]|nr:hypothetical protein [Nitrososphaera sp.]
MTVYARRLAFEKTEKSNDLDVTRVFRNAIDLTLLYGHDLDEYQAGTMPDLGPRFSHLSSTSPFVSASSMKSSYIDQKSPK